MLPIMTLISSRWFWYGLAIVAVLAVAGGAYAYVGSLNGKIEKLAASKTALEVSLKTTAAAYEAEVQAREKVDAVLGKRERDLSKLRANYDKLKRRITLLETEDPDVKAWMDAPLPSPLIAELHKRDSSSEASANVPTRGPDAAVPRADADRK